MSRPTRPAPPKPTPKPGAVKVFRAIYSYSAQYNDELSFEEGDILYVTDMETSKDWYKAKCGKKSGLIPSNYIEVSTESMENPLQEAAKRGNIGFLQDCLANNISVNGLDKSGSTALYWACHGGHIECVRILLSQPRIEVNAQNKLGDTALHAAAWKGHAEAVQMLLDKGARTDYRNNDKKTAYDLARNPNAAKLLMVNVTRVDDEDYIDEDGDDD